MYYFKHYTFKRILVFLIFLIAVINFSSCKTIKKYNDINSTTYENILNELGNKDNKYYVVVYSTTCKYCIDLEPYLIDYYKKTNKKTSNLPKLYVLCVDNKVNQEIQAESDEEYDNFVETTNYQDIKFSAEPGLIEVTNKKVTYLISSKTTTKPYTDIKNFLNESLS